MLLLFFVLMVFKYVEPRIIYDDDDIFFSFGTQLRFEDVRMGMDMTENFQNGYDILYSYNKS